MDRCAPAAHATIEGAILVFSAQNIAGIGAPPVKETRACWTRRQRAQRSRRISALAPIGRTARRLDQTVRLQRPQISDIGEL